MPSALEELQNGAAHALLILAQFLLGIRSLREEHVKPVAPIPHFLTVIQVLTDSLPAAHDRPTVMHDVLQDISQLLRSIRVTVFESVDGDEDDCACYDDRHNATAPNGKHGAPREAWFCEVAEGVNQKIAADHSVCG
jgi:hypothetical protein